MDAKKSAAGEGGRRGLPHRVKSEPGGTEFGVCRDLPPEGAGLTDRFLELPGIGKPP